VLIHLGEVAGLAAAMSLDQQTTPASLSVSKLQQRLLDDGSSIAFYNQHRQLQQDDRRGELL
jgi:hypothetical protein